MHSLLDENECKLISNLSKEVVLHTNKVSMKNIKSNKFLNIVYDTR